MKHLALPSQARLKELLDYNEETGVFRWKAKLSGVRVGDIAGSKNTYSQIKVDTIPYLAHRLAWRYVTGEDPGEFDIDHDDRNKHNNSFINLRKATKSENISNSGLRKDNKLGIKGVQQQGNRYVARIRKNGKRHYLGSYKTPEEAQEAYKAAALELHGEYANYG